MTTSGSWQVACFPCRLISLCVSLRAALQERLQAELQGFFGPRFQNPFKAISITVLWSKSVSRMVRFKVGRDLPWMGRVVKSCYQEVWMLQREEKWA